MPLSRLMHDAPYNNTNYTFYVEIWWFWLTMILQKDIPNNQLPFLNEKEKESPTPIH